MTITVILLCGLVSFLLYKLYTKRETLDDCKVLDNRLELLKLAYNDFEQGMIDKNLYRKLGFVFHPDFKNSWDYVPLDCQAYTRKMKQIDSNFWTSHRITPDFVIPANSVYMLYKEFLMNELNNCPFLKKVEVS